MQVVVEMATNGNGSLKIRRRHKKTKKPKHLTFMFGVRDVLRKRV